MVRRLSSDDTNSGPRAEQLSERLFWGRLLIGWVAALEEPDAVLGRQLASIDTDAGLQLGQDLETMVPLPPATHSPLPPIHHSIGPVFEGVFGQVHRISVDMEDR